MLASGPTQNNFYIRSIAGGDVYAPGSPQIIKDVPCHLSPAPSRCRHSWTPRCSPAHSAPSLPKSPPATQATPVVVTEPAPRETVEQRITRLHRGGRSNSDRAI